MTEFGRHACRLEAAMQIVALCHAGGSLWQLQPTINACQICREPVAGPPARRRVAQGFWLVMPVFCAVCTKYVRWAEALLNGRRCGRGPMGGRSQPA